MTAQLDPELATWESIVDKYEGGSILIGNGMSRNIWSRFRYGSLKDAAVEADIPNKLRPAHVKLFQELGTDNFEELLDALLTAQHVLDAIGTAEATGLQPGVKGWYERIRKALIEAVHYVHVPHSSVPYENLVGFWEEMRKYKTVYSTNYDLLIYWAMMAWAAEGDNDTSSFRDFFSYWDEYYDMPHTFDLARAKSHRLTQGRTDVMYLHGALHLFQLPSETEGKLYGQYPDNILDLFYDYAVTGTLPLFVSGGTAAEKRRLIKNSFYLEFCYNELEMDSSPLVIFGHSLGESDKHIRNAIDLTPGRKIAVSVSRPDAREIIKRKAKVRQYFPGAEIEFFDSRTHPLGLPSLEIQEIGDLP